MVLRLIMLECCSDERITTEVRQFCESLSQLLRKAIQGPFVVAVYTALSIQKAGWTAAVGVWAFYAIGVLSTRLFFTRVVGLVSLQGRLEGDFRRRHVDIRGRAEEVSGVWFSGVVDAH